ncbi:MAG: tRNA uridine-5-carboxymethylaminomethyl(34) synthesis enzyme MnmG [Phycisphaerales bacterium]|nr:tRNA uridine-5-carboxymethylaminomethyl(34) synthesis enzyme MnmG [Phycisphaerales bacterium]
MSATRFDVIVIGGGHAGAEAAWAAARLGAKTAMITFQRDAIGRMSCNPAIGGIGKGQMVREIDALGGLMGIVTDETGIQFRMLNRRKGPAVWAPRAQSDRDLYAHAVQRRLANLANLTMIEAGVDEILANPPAEGGRGDSDQRAAVTGVRLSDGREISAGAVVITSGTFLHALMHCGEEKSPGGRFGESAAIGLSASLAKLGLRLGRLKTGTPPRLDRTTIDYAELAEQPGDDPPAPFSFLTERIRQRQICCWITYTNARVHDLIRANLHRAPMFSGQIQAQGPRYCPSIEDKVVRFADKQEHQIFLEPEGYDSDRVYVNGISTSLPRDVQADIVASIAGLQRARILQWGYAVEYDFVPPDQIDATLMTRAVRGLFLAGQINGTSGYEEAAGQGIVAGINASRLVAGTALITLGRDEAYIGVMVDDLVTRGVVEPYRMFTSRAEHRLHLRYDNADARLTPIGRAVGLVDDDRWARFEQKRGRAARLAQVLESTRHEGRTIHEWLRRPEEDGERFFESVPALAEFRDQADIRGSALVAIKYAGYIDRQHRAIEQFRTLEDRPIPHGFDFHAIPQLRREAVDRWSVVCPTTVGQAARVSGIHPTDVSLLLVCLAAQ